jgi:hypothetical protein
MHPRRIRPPRALCTPQIRGDNLQCERNRPEILEGYFNSDLGGTPVSWRLWVTSEPDAGTPKTMAIPERPPPSRRFHVSIAEATGLVALVALACASPGIIPTEIVVVFFWLGARGGSERGRERLVSLGVVLGAMFLLPLANFVLPPLLDPAGIAVREWWRRWMGFFPIAAGAVLLVPVMVLHPGMLVISFFLAPVATGPWLYALTRLAGRSWARRAAAAVLALLASAAGTFMTYVFLTAGA